MLLDQRCAAAAEVGVDAGEAGEDVVVEVPSDVEGEAA